MGAGTGFSSEAVEVLPLLCGSAFGSQECQDCQDGSDSPSFAAGSFPALLSCAEKSVEESTPGAGGLPWKELPRCTEFTAECLVAVFFSREEFSQTF